ncbi:PSP1 domain-containing protein [Cyclobacterium roseum]|uniref:PSP1 domain-containing protein n=1 Tax=Cyclobacterium roseum TaxID=2666137 RepID=UPI0013915251|nr:regulatory iron-sulfur-containing complex subunit RicT [Cyclobacterium roseum]
MSGCTNCSTDANAVGGCQNNGSCGTEDCNKMNTFDWLSHMGIPEVDKFDVVEVKFKGGRKDYFRNTNLLPLTTGDPVVVDVPNGHHIGYVSLQGELVRLQMQKRKVKNDDTITGIYRIATQKDLEKWQEAKNREIPTIYRSKQIIDEIKLAMKLSDVEYQADNSKATFYYSADDRVDFRELIKLLASEFKIRVEMRQISLRQEAGRLGGIGVCGRELCCSTWIHDFKSVTTSAARYQNLSLNPSKLSGQCGRLKCCLNFELDSYLMALKDIPKIEKPLLTEAGPAKLQKTDIFRRLMWFSYNDDNNWHSIDCDRVQLILEQNEKGITPFSLKQDKAFEGEYDQNKTNEDLELLDKKFSQGKRKKKRKPKNRKPNPNNPQQSAGEGGAPPNKPRRNNRNPKRGNKNRNSPENPSQSQEKPGSSDSKVAGNNPRNRRRKPNPNRNKGGQNNPNKGAADDK